jgi:hypothetical protein
MREDNIKIAIKIVFVGVNYVHLTKDGNSWMSCC